MKPTPSEYTATPFVLTTRTRRVAVTVNVPLAVAQQLASVDRLGCAEVWDDKDITTRARQWLNPHTLDTNRHPAGRTLLAALLAQPGPRRAMTFDFSADCWQLIQQLADRLKITPGDWVLSAVAYRSRLESKLAA